MYNPYVLWNLYIFMRTIHGVYITYSFFVWLLGSLSYPVLYIMSFIYNPYEVKQIEDKKKQLKLNCID
ncbi:hypothetical protein [uncultured Mediterranean phage]|nr:hypothetical protein [uncultured Mediterranean phage]